VGDGAVGWSDSAISETLSEFSRPAKDAYATLKQRPQAVPEIVGRMLARDEDAERIIADLREEARRLRAERDALLRLATKDSLTGVWNRRAIFELLAKALARARRDSRPVAVLMADLDNFKSINDHLGHLVGDAVLREAARRLCSCVRRSDEVGRYGGEEFLIVLPGCVGQAALARAEQFRVAVGGTPILSAEGKIHVTCSFGLHSVIDTGYDRDEFVRKADAALYQAKRLGRNRVETAGLN
jgi:diguanylate cyclase (GGDEF)-like protein